MTSSRDANPVLVKSMSEIKRGDHISWPTDWIATHHAIVVETPSPRCRSLKVIHWYGDGSSISEKISSASIRQDDLFDVVDTYIGKGQVYRYEYPMTYSDDEVVERARSRLGEDGYSLLFKNCEHFARWCKADESVSCQVEAVAKGTALAVGAAATVALFAWGAKKMLDYGKEKDNEREKCQSSAS